MQISRQHLRAMSGLSCAAGLLIAPAASADLSILWHDAQDYGGVEGGSAVASDRQGNVIAMGDTGSGNAQNYIFAKYSPQGELLWSLVHDGPDGGYDEPEALAIGPDGAIYATGHDGEDWVTIAISPDGAVIWENIFHGSDPLGTAYPHDIEVDHDGNVIVVGWSRGTGTWTDLGVVKYAPDGSTIWVAEVSSPGFEPDQANAVAVDAQNNVYVTGEYATGNNRDLAVLKLNASGELQWIDHQDVGVPPAGFVSLDRGEAIAVAGDGSVYVAGTAQFSSGSSSPVNRAVLLKYSNDGAPLWTAVHQDGGTVGTDLEIAGDGTVFMAGNATGSSTTAFLAAFNPQGQQHWTALHLSELYPANYNELIAIDAAGAINLIGRSGSFLTVFRYSPTGELLSETTISSDGGGTAGGAISADDAGGIHVTGLADANLNFFIAALEVAQQPPLPGDVTGDGIVDVADLLAVINQWGACPAPPALCPADLDGDGAVAVGDLLMVISNWS